MDPTRQAEINGHIIKEYYWAGDYPCYIDHRLATVSFDEAVEMATADETVPTIAI